MKTGPILVRLLETRQTHRRRCVCCCSLALTLLPPGTLRAPGSPAAGRSPSNPGGFQPALAVAEEEERARSGLPTCLPAAHSWADLAWTCSQHKPKKQLALRSWDMRSCQTPCVQEELTAAPPSLLPARSSRGGRGNSFQNDEGR